MMMTTKTARLALGCDVHVAVGGDEATRLSANTFLLVLN